MLHPCPPVGLLDEAADGGTPVDGAPDGGRPDGPAFDADEDEDVEETRIVSRTAEHAPFLLHFSTGERLGVHGSALLGRLPRPEAGERFDDLLTIRDPGKSVSKTHLELGRDGDDLWVSDRYSGNGTVVRHIDGSIRRCEPGRRYRVERGARVDVGGAVLPAAVTSAAACPQ
ncbi:FHA domain-containing protein [Curtobacterium sp. MCPF17_052]|uniref:FHA domain-containing protein n=1 Tax=Curtobacterium sp. MCPF17_052 TaxID=2175655 RepID=UPI0024E03FB0|nr:FHA domain-containing protein [Curtobacterium sp. MCPF17_052]WIB12807.1 FHA domain-containing protein [Curtobacterium sp. MCPF17_052]